MANCNTKKMKDGGKVKKDNDVSDMVKPGPSRFFDSDKKKAAKKKADKKNQERINKQRKEVAKNPNKLSDMTAKTREDLKKGFKKGGKVMNPGMAKLKKAAPEVAKKMGYKKGGMACGTKTKKMKSGGMVKRADGCVTKGRTRGRMV